MMSCLGNGRGFVFELPLSPKTEVQSRSCAKAGKRFRRFRDVEPGICKDRG